MQKVTLRRHGSHHYLFVEGVEDTLHFPPLGDSHPSYWPAKREILEEARRVLLQEGNPLPNQGWNVQRTTLNKDLVALVEAELTLQLERQRAAQAEEEEADLEAELDRLGY